MQTQALKPMYVIVSRLRLGRGRREWAGWQCGEPVSYPVEQAGHCRLRSSLLLSSSRAGPTAPSPQWRGLAATAAEQLFVFSGDINQCLCPSQARLAAVPQEGGTGY